MGCKTFFHKTSGHPDVGLLGHVYVEVAVIGSQGDQMIL
jgi:hypothetical protein